MSAVTSIYETKIESIDGKPMALGEYKGKVLLIVNTASECGYTPQYKGLQALHERFSEKGLVVLGVPCNQFGGQEPGTEAEIKKFCELKYRTTFPMLKKLDVKGAGQHPLYKELLAQSSDQTDVKWNFEKFLVGRDGKVINRYRSKVEPESSELVQAIEKALQK